MRKFKKNIFLLMIFSVFFIGIKEEYNTNLVNAINLSNKKPIYKIDTEKKELFLTFDINWAEEDNTYKILEILKKHNVKGSFFIMGKWIKYPKGNTPKLHAIYLDGHDIGNHSYVHPDFKTISKERMREEVLKTEKIIEESIGIKTNIFRFPSGSYSEEGVNLIYNMSYLPVEWNIDSKDWRNEGKEKEYKNVRDKLENGAIILYHNNGKYTPENLEKLIVECKKEGYEFKKISERLK